MVKVSYDYEQQNSIPLNKLKEGEMGITSDGLIYIRSPYTLFCLNHVGLTVTCSREDMMGPRIPSTCVRLPKGTKVTLTQD